MIMDRKGKTSDLSDLTERLSRLVAFLPTLEDPTFQFGSWLGGTPMPHGMLHTPSFVMSDAAAAFVKTAHDAGWVLAGFDWTSWKGSAEAGELANSPVTLSQATSEQLAKLLTALVFQDSIDKGSLAEAFGSGLLLTIVRRADALLQSMSRAPATPHPNRESAA